MYVKHQKFKLLVEITDFINNLLNNYPSLYLPSFPYLPGYRLKNCKHEAFPYSFLLQINPLLLHILKTLCDHQ